MYKLLQLLNVKLVGIARQLENSSDTSIFCLVDLCQVEAEFEEQWAAGKVLGWENKGLEDEVIDLDYYSTVEELMEVRPEKLKEVGAFFFPLHLCVSDPKMKNLCVCV